VFNTTEIAELTARKRLLTAESELNRQALAMEMSRVRGSFAKSGEAFSVGKSAYPILMVAAPLAGFFMSRGGGFRGLFDKVLRGWELFQMVKPLWERFRQKSQSEDPSRPG
jgi:hypothetical protein